MADGRKKPTGNAEIGARIKAEREALGLSQTELGERVGLAQGSVAAIESGLQGWDHETIPKFALALGCSLDYLHYGPDVDMPNEMKRVGEQFLYGLGKKNLRKMAAADPAALAQALRQVAALLDASLPAVKKAKPKK